MAENIHNHSHNHTQCCECHQDHDHNHNHAHEHEHEHEHADCCCHDHHGHHDHDHDSCGCGCGCGHDHSHGGDLRGHVIRLAVGAVLFAAALILHGKAADNAVVWWISIALFAAAYFCAGGEVLLGAARGLLRGKNIFDENFLMSIATVGAFIVGQYAEGVAVMLFYQIGETLQGVAVSRSRRSITALMDVRPDHAVVLRDGAEMRVSPETVEVGETIILRPGEKVPLDAVITDGVTTLNVSALTGESMPRDAGVGDTVLSGSVNLTGVVSARVSEKYSESTVAKLLELVEHASEKKSHSEKFITRFARRYTPAVVIAALLVAVLPPIFGAGTFGEWLYNALIFLVISCPCALVVSVPLSFFSGIGCASRNGILVKGSAYLEALATAETVVFDKTGTLTRGSFKVSEISAQKCTADELIGIAAHAEAFSDHPAAKAIVAAYNGEVDTSLVNSVHEEAGCGVIAVVGRHRIAVGNAKLMALEHAEFNESKEPGTVVYVAADGKYLGSITVLDEIKSDAAEAVSELKKLGVRRTVMLTGDLGAVGESVASAVGVDECHCELMPHDKVHITEELIEHNGGNGSVAFVGDGINDAPVLARADIGIAMGGLGSDAAIEAADIVIMNDEPSRIALAMQIARRTVSIARQNIVFALAVKFAIMALSVFGRASMWLAVFADVGVALIAVLNSLRAFKVKK